MKLKKCMLLIGLAAAFLTPLVGCEETAFNAPAPRSEVTRTGLRPGFLAPEISGRDLTGTQMSLSDFRGKVVALEFWSST